MTGMILRLSVLAVVLAGCTPVPEVEEPLADDPLLDEPFEEDIPPELEECDAVGYRQLIGTPVADAFLPSSESLRVFGQTDIVTQEYLPQRTNIVYNAEGLIGRVYCG